MTLRHALAIPFILAIKMYQVTLAPFVGGQCRFHPTCSWYALEAYRVHGPVRGSMLSVRRLLKCHPFHRGGYDPVPEAEQQQQAAEQQTRVGSTR
jgi:uncharacterized protein